MWVPFLTLAVIFLVGSYSYIKHTRIKKVYTNFTKDFNPILTDIRYISYNDEGHFDGRSRIFIFKKTLIIIPEVQNLFGSEIFVFVYAPIYADALPKPSYLGVIGDYRISRNNVVITSTTSRPLHTRYKFQVVMELDDADIPLVRDFLEDDL